MSVLVITRPVPHGICCYTEDKSIIAYMYDRNMKAEDTEHKSHAKKFMPVWVYEKGYVNSPRNEEIVERIITILNTIKI